MRITVRTRDIEWNENLQHLAERRIDYAVDRHKTRIDRVAVLVSDLNGPRGGVDKLCHMTADVRGLGTVLITEKGANLLEAIGNAAGSLALRIRKAIERQRIPGAPDHRTTIRAAG